MSVGRTHAQQTFSLQNYFRVIFQFSFAYFCIICSKPFLITLWRQSFLFLFFFWPRNTQKKTREKRERCKKVYLFQTIQAKQFFNGCKKGLDNILEILQLFGGQNKMITIFSGFLDFRIFVIRSSHSFYWNVIGQNNKKVTMND